MAVLGHFWLLAIILFVLMSTLKGQDPDCDFFINVENGTTRYIYSPRYPGLYPRSKNCRWQAKCPVNMKCRLNCSSLSIPQTVNCNADRLLVSITGDSTLTGADKYCGTDPIEITSISNSISIGLITELYSDGGNFYCSLTAVNTEVDAAIRASIPSKCCGWKKTNRIVGGSETLVNEYPSMVGVVDNSIKIIICGGTIISKKHVLTASHCLHGKSPRDITILCGEHNVKSGTETNAATSVKSRQLILHPSYDPSGFENDIAIVVTDSDIVFTDKVGPACLPIQYTSTTFEGNVVHVIGWGTTSFAGMRSDYLQKVQLQVISEKSCASSLGKVVTPRIMCTFASGKDACQFDSGGPLLWQNPSNGRYYIIGIIIGGRACATSKPGINTRITSFLPWILSTTNGFQLCSV